MVKLQCTGMSPIHWPAFIYIPLLDGEPSKVNGILLSGLSFFKNLSLLLTASYLTQYIHVNPHFIIKREG